MNSYFTLDDVARPCTITVTSPTPSSTTMRSILVALNNPNMSHNHQANHSSWLINVYSQPNTHSPRSLWPQAFTNYPALLGCWSTTSYLLQQNHLSICEPPIASVWSTVVHVTSHSQRQITCYGSPSLNSVVRSHTWPPLLPIKSEIIRYDFSRLVYLIWYAPN